MEDRSLATLQYFPQDQDITHKLIMRIDDNPSAASEQIAQRTDANLLTMTSDFDVHDDDIHRCHINSPFGLFDQRIRAFFEAAIDCDLIIDITTLPKKFFFFLIKKALQWDHGFNNIIVTYAEPEQYCDDNLAGNPEPWEVLPGFRAKLGTPSPDKIVVGIGYEPLGLPGLAESGEFNEGTTVFLLPFPTQPDRNTKNWKFIHQIFPNSENLRLDIRRVDAMNVPEVFDTISGVGEHGETVLSLAPFGPKPVSLAMALYASKTAELANNTSVLYTQPTYYNPDYSIGIKMRSGIPIINTYCIKRNGVKLY